jgi:hypothetical protein
MSRSAMKRALSALTLASLLALPTAPALAATPDLADALGLAHLAKVVDAALYWATGGWLGGAVPPREAPVAETEGRGTAPRIGAGATAVPARRLRRGTGGPSKLPPVAQSACGDEGTSIDPDGACHH